MNHHVLYQWSNEIATHLPCLNSWQISNVAQFSLGIIYAESCQQEQVARQVATGEQISSCTRRWRRFLDNEAFPLAHFFVAWTRWVTTRLGEAKIYLLVDETKLGDRLGAMVVGVAWEKRCIPLAWCGYQANDAAAYPAEGQVQLIARLLQLVKQGIDESRQVVVLADRGLGTSPALCQEVAALGWFYLFRVTRQCKLCTPSGEFTIADMAQPGQQWSGEGLAFKKRGRLPATAHAIWTAGYDQPWALVTNDPTLNGYEYAQRNWQEQAFRDLKSGGWQWQASRIRHADHLERLIVLLTLAYAWCIALGSQAVEEARACPLQRHAGGALRRYWSLFKEGLQYFFEVIDRGHCFVPLIFIPDPRVT